jgi:hypothetical protein
MLTPSTARAVLKGAIEVSRACLMPLALFFVGSDLANITVGALISCGWTAGVIAWQVTRSKKLSGLIIISLTSALMRLIGTVATGSSFVFFALPTVSTATTAALLAWSTGWATPLLVRIAGDVVPVFGAVLAVDTSRRVITRLSWTWATVYTLNAVVTLTLLVATPLHFFVFAHILAGWTLAGIGGAVSVQVTRRHGSHIWDSLKQPSPVQPSLVVAA